MTHSAFAMPPSPAIMADAAFGSAQGKSVPGGYFVYPELAPAGLWTTAADLARLQIDLQSSAAGKRGRRLSPVVTRLMMIPVKDNWGLGVGVYPQGAPRFMHDGVNAGYESFMVSHIGKGDGIVMLTNGGRRPPADGRGRPFELSSTRFRSEGLGVTVEFAPDFSSCTMIEGAPPMKLVRSAPSQPAS